MLGQTPDGQSHNAFLPGSGLAFRASLRQAEQDLIAANAQVGLARSLYFPAISLSGLFGWSSTDLSNLFSGPSRVWNSTGSLAAPVFAGGAIAGQVKTARAVEQQALARYEQVVQGAFRGVEDALVSQKRTRQQVDALTRQVDALRNAARFARLRFDNGQSSYNEVLDAERSLFASELLLIETRGTLFQTLVNVYQAMGGGWVVEAEKLAEPESERTTPKH